jgi:UDP-2-acetamido-3-amino-2,3-dideoxy-glucuronate N-acetyltransferase
MKEANVFIHESAEIDSRAEIGEGSKIWINVQIREGVVIGKNCIISKDAYIDTEVSIGDNCKIQNGVYIYKGVTLESKIFVGPNVTFTNDKYPRAFNVDWKIVPTILKEGVSIGAGAVIVCGITIHEYAMVAAGSVVTKDVEPYTLVMGNPAKPVGKIDMMGNLILKY